MAKLSVNINKIATLRNARGGNMPNVIQVAIDVQNFGAEGILNGSNVVAASLVLDYLDVFVRAIWRGGLAM